MSDVKHEVSPLEKCQLRHDLIPVNYFQVTVFYCGNPGLADALLQKSNKFDFSFKKEIF